MHRLWLVLLPALLVVAVLWGATWEAGGAASVSPDAEEGVVEGPYLAGHAPTPGVAPPGGDAAKVEVAPALPSHAVVGRVTNWAGVQGLADVTVVVSGLRPTFSRRGRGYTLEATTRVKTDARGYFHLTDEASQEVGRWRHLDVRVEAPAGYLTPPDLRLYEGGQSRLEVDGGIFEPWGPLVAPLEDPELRVAADARWAPIAIRLRAARTLVVQCSAAKDGRALQAEVRATWAHGGIGTRHVRMNADELGGLRLDVPADAPVELEALLPHVYSRSVPHDFEGSEHRALQRIERRVESGETHIDLRFEERTWQVRVARLTLPDEVRVFPMSFQCEDPIGRRVAYRRGDKTYRLLLDPHEPLRVRWSGNDRKSGVLWWLDARVDSLDEGPIELVARRGVRIAVPLKSDTRWFGPSVTVHWAPKDERQASERTLIGPPVGPGFTSPIGPRGPFPPKWKHPKGGLFVPPVPGRLYVHDAVTESYGVQDIDPAKSDHVLQPPDRPGRTLTGVIADRASLLRDGQRGPSVHIAVGPWRASVNSDKAGRFTFRGLPPGEATIWLEGHSTRRDNPRSRWAGRVDRAGSVVLHMR